MSLLDLPADALRTVLRHLKPRDLCRCKAVCHKLSLLACEDSMWAAQCQQWFQRHGRHSGLSEVIPRRLCSQLQQLPQQLSHAKLYETLHTLGGWPEGLWYRVDPSGHPHGALVWVDLKGSVLHMSRLNPAAEVDGLFCRILLDTKPVQVAIGSPFQENHLTLPADVLRINSRAGTLVVQLPHTEAEPGAKSPVTWHDSQGSHEVTHMKEWIRQLPMTQWHNLFGAWTNEDEALHSGPNSLRLSRIMPLPSALPHPREPLPSLTAGFSACEALRRLQGLWTAWYGGHGPEILHVWFDESVQTQHGASPAEEPDHISSPRLIGCKVTGDPNVPANEWSFKAQAAEMRAGRWDGRGTWRGEEEEEWRPIVSFNGLPTLVDMRERKVQARFLCQGRINHDPENYKPLWVPAQLVIYEGPKPMFSVLFDDIHHRYRHIMDLEPVPLPCRPSLSWLHDV